MEGHRRLSAAMEGAGALFGDAVADADALLLAQMLGSGLDDEGFATAARITVQTEAKRTVPQTLLLHRLHRGGEVPSARS